LEAITPTKSVKRVLLAGAPSGIQRQRRRDWGVRSRKQYTGQKKKKDVSQFSW